MVNVLQGIEQPIALIGVGEKGYIDFQLSTYVQPGHLSIPLGDNAIQVLAGAIKAIRANPMPSLFGNLTLITLKHYASYVANQTIREIFGNPLKVYRYQKKYYQKILSLTHISEM